jgi:putative pyruvate formate lyase activating enzyme
MHSHNINLVSPTHYASQILDGLEIAKKEGLNIPIVFNTGGYDSEETIEAFKNVADVYIVDMKYSNNEYAEKFSYSPGYVEINRRIVKQMYENVGQLQLDNNGIATKGVIIRCLVLPNDISGTCQTLEWIEQNISDKVHISLMSQYYPIYKAKESPELNRKLTYEEYSVVNNKLNELGFSNGWVQDNPEQMDDSFGGHRIKRV